ncbi:MAG: nucleotidyltransferase family protein [Gammaproteobacteria bacterium]|nr:nucleotidyltransferase family protein [Gammaproteobacteria bacterium]
MKTAMLLAAGRGERLRPLTDHYPKALCKLYDKPLIDHHLQHLAAAGFQRVIINHAYLGGHIRRFVQQNGNHGLDIIFSPEPPGGLETGGGIVNVLEVLGPKPFVTINSDIYCDYDLSKLKLPKESLAHIVLVNKPSYRQIGDYGLQANGLVTNEDKQFIFSGINIFHPDFFKQAVRGRYSLTPMMRHFTDLKQITGEMYPGVWFDIGTPEQLKLAKHK